MKKLLGIMVLGLLFISIDLSNPTRVEAVTYEELMEEALGPEWKKKLKEKKKKQSILYKLNPLNYFEKRKECKEEADRADTVYQGKERYKNCMAD